MAQKAGKATSQATATASVRIEESLRDRAKVVAAQRKTSIYALLNEALEEYLSNKKRSA